ncbi:MAG: peptide-methionine (S)-S-oxide reductase MsrA [Francisellaceae bacterium]
MNKQKAYFAGGCFWGVEYYFTSLPGVSQVTSGYMGGALDHPSYQDVKSGTTGHLEVVEIDFDADVVDYESLARLFFEIHDPTQINGQGVDIGSQYLSAIFYADEAQRQVAEALIKQLKRKGFEVVTRLIDATSHRFWSAEDYHQQYYGRLQKSPECHWRVKRFDV